VAEKLSAGSGNGAAAPRGAAPKGAAEVRAAGGSFIPYALLAPLTLYFLVFLVAPLLIIFVYSLSTRGVYGTVEPSYTLDNYRTAINAAYLEVFWRSVRYAGLTSTLCLILGYPLAYTIAVFGGRHKSTLLLLVMLPFWTSYLVRIYAWKTILATKGLLNVVLLWSGLVSEPLQILNTPAAVVLGLTYGFLPFMTLPLYVSLEKLDPNLLHASEDLGANPFGTFTRVVLPLTMPGVLAGFLLTFIPAVGDFVTPDLLGGPQTQMIGNLIESRFFPEQDWPMGSAMAFLLMGILMIGLWTYARLAPRALGEN